MPSGWCWPLVKTIEAVELECDFLQRGQFKESDFLAGSSDLQKWRSQWPGRSFAAFYDLGHFCWLYSMGPRLHKHIQIQGQGDTVPHLSGGYQGHMAEETLWQPAGEGATSYMYYLRMAEFQCLKVLCILQNWGQQIMIHCLSLSSKLYWNTVMFHLSWASQMALVLKNLSASVGDIRDVSSIPRSRRSPGGEHGNPLQCSCLENPMDRKHSGLQSTGSQRVGHGWSALASMHVLSIHAEFCSCKTTCSAKPQECTFVVVI